MGDPRDYGYGDSPEVVGAPQALGKAADLAACPNCECVNVQEVRIQIKNPPAQLKIPDGHVASGTYIGCPACPWASPMVAMAVPKEYFIVAEGGDEETHGGLLVSEYEGWVVLDLIKPTHRLRVPPEIAANVATTILALVAEIESKSGNHTQH